MNRDADRATWILVVALPLILAASGFALWRRIARPVFDLVVVADRFGAGDLGARAQVHRDDELGALTRTFNTMAEDIQARERERHDFMCSIVHDLSSPVAVISGAAQLLSRGLPPEKAQVWLERIATQAGRLASMNDDLLESARIGAGQLSIVLEDADLTSLVATSVAEQKLVHDKRVFTWSDPGPCRMLLDTKRIAQILANLITNAAKYSSAPTAIEVRLEASEQEATISIIDRGSGMSDEDILQLFKPFGRLARTERSVRGTGLGLYSVKKIIEAHGGTVSISSRLGEGTTVSIRLPRAYQSQGEGTQS